MNDRRLFLQSLGMAMLAPLVGGAALASPLEAAAAATATPGCGRPRSAAACTW